MTFSIIGTGNMAYFLAEELSAAGHKFIGIWGRNTLAANKIAIQYPTLVYSSLQDIKDEEEHYCFIAIKDTAIAEIAAQLNFKHTTLIHTAGASPLQLLGNQTKHTGIFWPIYSIVADNLKTIKDIPIAIQGNNPQTENAILDLAKSITDKAFIANEEQRTHLHLAAVFANNFSNHLMAIAQEICIKQHLSFDYLKPIVEQTFERLKTKPAKNLQTGPAIRDDKMTMQKHIDLLKSNPEWALLYQSLSNSIRKMYSSSEE
ncbi:MAG: Rossmann-like and DUF2520 domain-containing protein [Bacteroidota bacterium]